MVKKVLPQCGSTQYWYDKADRMAYMRDPALGSRYRFYLYDNLGRLCVQGTCINCNQDPSILSATTYVSGSDGICKTGYTVPYTINDPKLEIVNYYDNYDFIGKNLTSIMPTVTINQNQEQYAIGSQTGLVAYATNGEALDSIDVYDQKGQVVRSVRKGINGYIEDVITEYTFTGTIDNTVANVNVGYGSDFTAKTDYTYKYGKKTKMELSISHGMTTLPRETEYLYDAIGRLSSKSRQLTTTAKSDCSYSYDVHGWLTGINSNGFSENLYYADGLDGGCYNGNISTMKWKTSNDGGYRGYNLKYDDNNRMYSAVYGSGDNLSSNKNYFDEHVVYDCNGNITGLQRSGLVDKVHGSFGMVDNLYMTYGGNRLTSVRDNATQLTYEGATDFNGEPKKEYPLTYNDAGSLVSDAGRKIAKIDYDNLNNPVRIQFTDGNVTKYIYSATGEKLRVTYQTAVPNISVAIDSIKELSPSEIQCTDYTDYLLDGNLTLKNGHIGKYQFDEGYCQAEKNIFDANKDDFTFCYYDQDHLGNIRQVTKADVSQTGNIVQTINYYPFGMQFCDGTTCYFDQKHKYNGKEFDNMHGLNTYDYGARQYNPVTARWDRMDPLCDKYYSISPYAYCCNNPVKYIDPDGRSTWVINIGNGKYQVVGGNLNDKDKNIYAGSFNKEGAFVRGNSIGITTSMTSFYNSDKKGGGSWSTKSIIDTKDKSGDNFLGQLISDNPPMIDNYMMNARNNKPYDFKVTNGTNHSIPGIDIYRGMPVGVNGKGQTIYTSARDIGNIAAGYVAGVNGMTWEAARVAFDFYQGAMEGSSTRNAERYGWQLGYNNTGYNKKMDNLLRSLGRSIISIYNYLTR